MVMIVCNSCGKQVNSKNIICPKCRGSVQSIKRVLLTISSFYAVVGFFWLSYTELNPSMPPVFYNKNSIKNAISVSNCEHVINNNWDCQIRNDWQAPIDKYSFVALSYDENEVKLGEHFIPDMFIDEGQSIKQRLYLDEDTAKIVIYWR